jgi:hypothetical protein
MVMAMMIVVMAETMVLYDNDMMGMMVIMMMIRWW